MEDWQNLYNRLDRAHKLTLGMRFGIKDLWRMHRAVYDRLQLANAEWVNCRQRGRGSPRFDELMTQAEEALKNFEGHLLIAKLSNKEQR